METFEFRGWKIRYRREGSGEPVIFLHNGGTSHAIWAELLPRIAQTHEVFAVDLLGYGESDKPGTSYSLDDYAASLGELIDSQCDEPVTLVGNCMGSAISLQFAMKRPEDVRALVLINPLTEATFSAGWLGSLLRMRRGLPRLTGPLFDSLTRFRLPRFMARESLRFQLGREGRAQGLEQNADLCGCATAEGHLESMLAVLDDMRSYAALDRLVPGDKFPPISTIWGLENRVLSPEAGRHLNRNLRPVREEWLEGCGHLPMLERPERVLSIIEEVLRIEPASGAA